MREANALEKDACRPDAQGRINEITVRMKSHDGAEVTAPMGLTVRFRRLGEWRMERIRRLGDGRTVRQVDRLWRGRWTLYRSWRW